MSFVNGLRRNEMLRHSIFFAFGALVVCVLIFLLPALLPIDSPAPETPAGVAGKPTTEKSGWVARSETARNIGFLVFSLVGGTIGIVVSFYRTGAQRQEAATNRERMKTEQLSELIRRLCSKKEEDGGEASQLGAVYSLERMVRESDDASILEFIFNSFLAYIKSSTKQTSSAGPCPEDCSEIEPMSYVAQAVLNALKKWPEDKLYFQKDSDNKLDFSSAVMNKADFTKAGKIFDGAMFTDAYLFRTPPSEISLTRFFVVF